MCSDGAGNNHSTGDARWLSDTQSDGQNVLSSEFHDVQVGKFDDDSLDETICPDGDSASVELFGRMNYVRANGGKMGYRTIEQLV